MKIDFNHNGVTITYDTDANTSMICIETYDVTSRSSNTGKVIVYGKDAILDLINALDMMKEMIGNGD